jgi:hypothetical protein
MCISTLMDRSIKRKVRQTPADFQSPPKGSIWYGNIDAERAKFVNRLTVINANDLVFARTASAGIAALVEKYRNHGTQLEHTAVQTAGRIVTQAGIFVGKKRLSG